MIKGDLVGCIEKSELVRLVSEFSQCSSDVSSPSDDSASPPRLEIGYFDMGSNILANQNILGYCEDQCQHYQADGSLGVLRNNEQKKRIFEDTDTKIALAEGEKTLQAAFGICTKTYLAVVNNIQSNQLSV